MSSDFHIFEVSSEEQGMGLLKFLRVKLWEAPSTKALKRAIDQKRCKVNGRVEYFSSYPLAKGDKVEIELISEERFSHKTVPITTLYEDEYLLLCNKPAGIVSEERNFPFPPLHRLDKDTTGVLILGKTPDIEKKIIDLFQKQEVHKEYLALVDGIVSKSSGIIDKELSKKFTYEGQAIWSIAKLGEGLKATTLWTKLDQSIDATLLLCEPRTGRTHQLRVHLNALGHPILGDHQYGKKFICKYPAKRHLLHAFRIAFSHPITHKLLQVTAPIPSDFKAALKALNMRWTMV